jgi:flagellar biosynthesis regulator FlaF
VKKPTWTAITSDVAENDIGLAVSLTADIIIAGAVVFSLLRRRSEIARTQSLVSRLISFAIGTGLLTT